MTENQMLWLNDADVPPRTNKDKAESTLAMYETLRSNHVDPSAIADDNTRKEYATWLEAHPE